MSVDNPEIITCAEKNDCDGIRRCLSNKEDINSVRSDGRSALLVAALNGNLEAVELLIENGANVKLKNKKGGNATLHAAYRDNCEIVDYLVKNGCDPNDVDNNGRNTLHMACSQGSNETVQLLLEGKMIHNVNAKTNDSRDALLMSIEGNCSLQTVLCLLINGADVNTVTKEGRNVLMESVRLNCILLFHVFYRYSQININRIDNVGNTCLHYACGSGNLHAVRSLLHRGAFVKVENKNHEYPVTLAQENHFDPIVTLLNDLADPPPAPIVTQIGKKEENSTDLMIAWNDTRRHNYYPQITAVEIQMKLRTLWDPWKTIQTLQVSENPHKEYGGETVLSFEDGEMTDIEEESDLKERQETESACCSIKDDEVLLEKRQESNGFLNGIKRVCVISDYNPKSNYALRIRCANKYGWSNYGTVFNFSPKEITNVFKEEDKGITRRSSLLAFAEDLSQAKKAKKGKEKRASLADSSSRIQSILSGGVPSLQAAVQQGTDLTMIRNAAGMSLLHCACAENNEAIVRSILENHWIDINDETKNGSLPIHYAILNNSLPCALLLMENCCNVTKKDSNGLTPFLLACERGNLQMIEVLMKYLNEEEVHIKDQYDRNGLVLAINGAHLHIADFLLQHGFSANYTLPPPQNWSLLHFSICTKNDSIVKYCLALGLSPLYETDDGRNVVDFCKEYNVPTIEAILKHYAALPESVKSFRVMAGDSMVSIRIGLPEQPENHPLLQLKRVEVAYKKLSLLSTFTTVAIELSSKDIENHEALVQIGGLQINTNYKLKARLWNGNGAGEWKIGDEFSITGGNCDLESMSEERSIQSCGIAAIQKGVTVKVDYEEKKQIDVLNMEKSDDLTKSIFSALDTANIEYLQTLENVNFESIYDSLHLSPFQYAVLSSPMHTEEENKKLIDFFIDRKCDINRTTDTTLYHSLSPLSCACMLNTDTLLRYLKEKGGDLRKGQVNGINSCVFYCLLSSSTATIKYLVDQTISIDELRGNRQSLLHIIAMVRKTPGFECICDYLIEKGCDMNQIDKNGDTVVHIAIDYDNILFIIYAMNHHFNLALTNKKGYTPYQYAEITNHFQVLEVLTNHYRVSFPPHHVLFKSQSVNRCVLRWETPIPTEGVPAPDVYEIEFTNCLLNMTLLLPPEVTTTYVFLNVPFLMHRWISGRIRAHNENGWSEWSLYSVYEEESLEEQQLMADDFYLWLYCLDLQYYYNDLKRLKMDNLNAIASLNEENLRKLELEPCLIDRLLKADTKIVECVLEGCQHAYDKKNACYSWYKYDVPLNKHFLKRWFKQTIGTHINLIFPLLCSFLC